MLDPRLLRTYAAVCREGSISGAARRLNISQPSVSVAIAQLERRLGTSLFERSRQGIVLTAAGRALRGRAEAMETLLADAAEEVTLATKGVLGPLRIAGTPGALVSLVPQAIGPMEEHGRFALQILERPDAELNDLLRTGEIEIAVATTGIDRQPADIEERSVVRDPFALIVGRAHDALGPAVSLAEVAEFGWVLPEAYGAFHRQIEALFLGTGVPFPTDVIRCDSLLTTKAIVRRTARVCVLPRGVVSAELSIGVLRAVRLSENVTRAIGVRTLRDRPLSVLADRFVQAISSRRMEVSFS
ncbi:LysR family transcriptional regulator (plasmid) [Croceibacterium sp. TMG7-5b_MA50]|uniref:LysR family transcriptional regulator n=1 Tax=Croceibacterium sp. TMG7-5b_MA50 TaxID=3121290 RepID=UPI003221C840